MFVSCQTKSEQLARKVEHHAHIDGLGFQQQRTNALADFHMPKLAQIF